jgi:putative redox protein
MSRWLEGEVELVRDMVFRAMSGSGHEIVLDASAEAGGTNAGLRPMEALLLALGGCTGMDVISILRKMRQEVTGYRVRVRAMRRGEHPRVFTHVTVEHVVQGRHLNEEMVRRAVELSARRYCSVSAMLQAAVPIDVGYRMVDVDTGAEVAAILARPEQPAVEAGAPDGTTASGVSLVAGGKY